MTPLVIRMMIVSDAATWSITYNHHSDDHNIFIIQASGVRLTTLLCKTNNEWLKKYFYFFCKTHYLNLKGGRVSFGFHFKFKLAHIFRQLFLSSA
jgi:hypothetical protein